jgi:hypothetical protein
MVTRGTIKVNTKYRGKEYGHMKMGVMTVTSTKQPPIRSKIKTSSPLLAGAGFVHGAAVCAVPCQDGFTLTLGDVKGDGKLITVGLDSNAKPTISLNLTGSFPTGLIAGDFLAAGFEFGKITAHKLPPADKYYVVGSQSHAAYLQFSGGWLADAGIMPDTLATVTVTHEGVIFSVWEDTTATYSEIVRYAREHKAQLIQARKNQHITTLDIPAYVLNKASLGNGDIAGIHYEHGKIIMFKPDLRKLGFEVLGAA